MALIDRIENVLRILCTLIAVIFVGLSIILIYVGCVVDNSIFRYEAFISPTEFANTSRATILTGVSLMWILWLQISGAVRQWTFVMFLNASLLAYLLTVGGVLLNLMTTEEHRLHVQLYYGLLASLSKYGEQSHQGSKLRMAWTHLQLRLGCCGVNNYTDWKTVKMPGKHEPPVPFSCCRRLDSLCAYAVNFTDAQEDSKHVYTQGCSPQAENDIHMNLLPKVILPFEVLALVSVLISVFLIWKWRRDRLLASRSVATISTITGSSASDNRNLIEDVGP